MPTRIILTTLRRAHPAGAPKSRGPAVILADGPALIPLRGMGGKAKRTYDLVVVSNRLPVDRVIDDDGSAFWTRSPGGLVTALEPVMRSADGAWVGWGGQ